MNEQLLSSAIEDVKLIKQVIDRTAESVLSFGRILIGWGILYFSKLVLVLIIGANLEFSNNLCSRMPLLFYSVYPVYAILAVLIYKFYSKRLNIVGMGKQLMYVWLYIIGYNLLLPIITLALRNLLKIDASVIYMASPAISFITFAIGFYVIYDFTKFKLPKWLSIIYAVIGYFALVPGVVNYTIFEYVWPTTFLVLGGYFEYKSKKARGN